jgi:hypothetical protein
MMPAQHIEGVIAPSIGGTESEAGGNGIARSLRSADRGGESRLKGYFAYSENTRS